MDLKCIEHAFNEGVVYGRIDANAWLIVVGAAIGLFIGYWVF